MAFRAKTYANKQGKADGGKPNKLQVSGDIAEFNKLAKGDKETREIFDAAISEALKK
jgi:hypothetical protein